jgi:hypothetical protein
MEYEWPGMRELNVLGARCHLQRPASAAVCSWRKQRRRHALLRHGGHADQDPDERGGFIGSALGAREILQTAKAPVSLSAQKKIRFGLKPRTSASFGETSALFVIERSFCLRMNTLKR